MKISALFILLFMGEKLKVQCFNFDTDFPTIFERPALNKQKSYFGYALAMNNGSRGEQWVRIGAPKADDIHYPETQQSGSLYSCSMQKCQPMLLPHDQSLDERQRGMQHIWNYGFIGGTMDVSYVNERFVVCGFRHYYLNDLYHDYESFGTCFWSPLHTNTFETITPLLDIEKNIISGGYSSLYYNAFGEIGFSLHFSEKENELILGAPGVYLWAGTILKLGDLITPAPNRLKRALGYPFKQVEEANSVGNENFILFGYSVSSGYYYGSNTLYYAAGAPKDNDYYGTVTIFRLYGDNMHITKKELLYGETFGEYFGSSIASGDINNDNYDDILVGSPFYAKNTFNEGRVYLFLGQKLSLQKSIILNGEQKGGQFGATIMYLGDINNDGFGDVAVGAPYENEQSGNVYIYKGTKEGLQLKPVQKLVGKDIATDILGFGLSISKAIDLDNNGYKDIAIGAPLSEKAILFRSKPLVTIIYYISPNPKILPQNATEFDLNICFSYKIFAEEHVNLTYHITVDEEKGRATIGSLIRFSKNITVFKDTFCERIKVNIKSSPNFDIETPIKISFSYGLRYPVSEKSPIFISDQQTGMDGLCVRCPVLDKDNSNQTFFDTEIAFVLNCGPDNICRSNLTTDISFPELRQNTFILGSNKFIKLNVSIKNTGENAFSTKLYLFLPKLSLRQIPSKCVSEKAGILCDVANPLENNKSEHIELELELTKINTDFTINQLSITTKVSTTSIDTNDDTNIAILYLQREADITIYGKTDQGTNFYSNTSGITDSKLIHTYKVEKFGFSPLEKLKIKIQVPFMYTMENKNYTFLDFYGADRFFGAKPFNCEYRGISVKTTKVMSLEQYLPRQRRDAEKLFEVKINENLKIHEANINPNKALFLNCTSDYVSCFDILCYFGPYNQENVPASIELNMIVNISTISEIASNKKMVLISTKGEVMIESPINFIQTGNRSDIAILSSPFTTAFEEELKLALWIIIVGVLLGLLLLVLITLQLIRMGFFKRNKKQELKNLKAAAEQEDKIRSNIKKTEEPEDQIEELEQFFPDQVEVSSRENICEL